MLVLLGSSGYFTPCCGLALGSSSPLEATGPFYIMVCLSCIHCPGIPKWKMHDHKHAPMFGK